MASSSRGIDGTRIVPNDFATLEAFLTSDIHILKVDQLKQLVTFINEHSSNRIRKDLRKAELVFSISDAFRDFRNKGDIDRYRAARTEFNRIAYPSYNNRGPVNVPGFGGYTYPGTSYPAAASGSGYAVPYSRGSVVNGAGMSNVRPTPAILKWKTTPAWKVIKAVSDLTPVPAAEDDAQKRVTKTSSFSCPEDVSTEVKAAPVNGKRKALRLFCTSSEYYPQGDTTSFIPQDFPNNYEILLNTQHLRVTKGLKGKANSTAPVDLMQANAMKWSAGIYNLINFTHTGPTLNKKTKLAKKFYFQVCLTEMTNSDAMKQRIMARKKTAAEVVQQMQNKDDEDDIEVGSARMSLKCPLSYIRIQNPMRSDICTHVQCCDLDSWLMMNETTPSWTCPTCDRELALEQIFLDEFFASILTTCPDSVDEVLLESNGDWHTEDGKYGSASWKAANPNGPPASARLLAGSNRPSRTATPEVKVKLDSPAIGGSSTLANGESSTLAAPVTGPTIDLVELSDSDDDDDDVVKVPMKRTEPLERRSESTMHLQSTSSVAPSEPPDLTTGPGASMADAIDIDDSDDDDAHIPRATNAKQPTSGEDVAMFNRQPRPYSGAGTPVHTDQNGKRSRESPESRDSYSDKRRRHDSTNGNQPQASGSRPSRPEPPRDNSFSDLDWSPLMSSHTPSSGPSGPLSDPRSSGSRRHEPLPPIVPRPGQEIDDDMIVCQPSRRTSQRSLEDRPNHESATSAGQSYRQALPPASHPNGVGRYQSNLPPPRLQAAPHSSYSKP